MVVPCPGLPKNVDRMAPARFASGQQRAVESGRLERADAKTGAAEVGCGDFLFSVSGAMSTNCHSF